MFDCILTILFWYMLIGFIINVLAGRKIVPWNMNLIYNNSVCDMISSEVTFEVEPIDTDIEYLRTTDSVENLFRMQLVESVHKKLRLSKVQYKLRNRKSTI